MVIDKENMEAIHGQRITNYKLPLATLIALVFTLTFTFIVLAQNPTPTDDEVNKIAKQLYCPVCESTPLDVCPTGACRQWRELIREMLTQGKSEAEIKQYFVEHYGPQVLNEPPNRIVAYMVPIAAFLLGAFMLLRGFQAWKKPITTDSVSVKKARPNERRNGQKETMPIHDPYIAKLEEELKKRN
jgi:cytochrome c-type biogenesis protein CcmH